MIRYVDFDKVIEEIDRRIKSANNDVNIGAIESLTISKTLTGFKSFLGTLEVSNDAFIDKADNYLRNKCQRFILTEKDIEDFKNYMKGEQV